MRELGAGPRTMPAGVVAKDEDDRAFIRARLETKVSTDLPGRASIPDPIEKRLHGIVEERRLFHWNQVGGARDDVAGGIRHAGTDRAGVGMNIRVVEFAHEHERRNRDLLQALEGRNGWRRRRALAGRLGGDRPGVLRDQLDNPLARGPVLRVDRPRILGRKPPPDLLPVVRPAFRSVASARHHVLGIREPAHDDTDVQPGQRLRSVQQGPAVADYFPIRFRTAASRASRIGCNRAKASGESCCLAFARQRSHPAAASAHRPAFS